jgi:hypothetical protein
LDGQRRRPADGTIGRPTTTTVAVPLDGQRRRQEQHHWTANRRRKGLYHWTANDDDGEPIHFLSTKTRSLPRIDGEPTHDRVVAFDGQDLGRPATRIVRESPEPSYDEGLRTNWHPPQWKGRFFFRENCKWWASGRWRQWQATTRRVGTDGIVGSSGAAFPSHSQTARRLCEPHPRPTPSGVGHPHPYSPNC